MYELLLPYSIFKFKGLHKNVQIDDGDENMKCKRFTCV